ncbi:MAG: hypothetical protein JWQ94_944, partial [Tardiphaga sp.]|nr:hypothetical protein [Tardiphaga sp.]
MRAISPVTALHDHPSQTPERYAARFRWLLTTLLLGIVLAVPFFLTDVPPVLDYPNHLARYFVLAHPDDPALSQMYAPHWRILPNLGMDVIGVALLQIADVHVAGRLLLALSLFAPLAGVIIYSRVMFGRFSYWPLASGAIAYNAVFFLGFMNFLLSLGLALAAAAAFIAVRRRRHPMLAAGVGAVAACVVFFAHIFGVMLFALLVGTRECARLWRLRSSGTFLREACWSAVGLVLMFAPVLVLFRLGPLSDAPATVGAWRGLPKLWTFFVPFMTTNVNLTLLTALVVFCFAVTAWRNAIVAPGAALALAVLGAAFVLAPSAIGNGTFIDARIAIMIALLAFAGVMPRVTRAHAIAAALVFAALIALRTAYVATTWWDSRGDVAELRAAIAPVQPGSRVLVMRGHPSNWSDVDVPRRALPGIYRLDGQLAALLV